MGLYFDKTGTCPDLAFLAVVGRNQTSMSREKFNLDLQNSPQQRALVGGTFEIFIPA